MRVAVAQIEPKLGETERNLEICVARLEAAAAAGAVLLVLPECAIPGYMFDSAAEAMSFAEEIPGPSTEVLAAACRRSDMHVVCGLLERDGEHLHNAAVLIGPEGLIGSYRKTHLPFLGVDRFTVPGDELPVYDTPLGRVGLEICYDLRFPEATRTLALAGADIVAHPTAFPVAARIQTELITVARAAENRIFLLTANRVGKERNGEFCGWSQIVDPYGVRLAEAGATEEVLLVAEIDIENARDKDYVIPGEYELYLFGDRRPELYGALVEERQPAATSWSLREVQPCFAWLQTRRRASSSVAPIPAGIGAPCVLALLGFRRRTTTGVPGETISDRSERPLERRRSMAIATDRELVPEAILEEDGLKVSASPWGPDDEIGRLNWITPETNAAILDHLDGAHLFDLNVEYFIGMPSWVAAGEPPYGIWMTHTPQGSIHDNLSGVGASAHERYSYCGDSIHLYTHCGTHVDTLNHLGHHGMFWNGWTADKDLGSRIWMKGGLDKYPPIIARGVLLDVAGMHGVDCLPEGYGITPKDLQDCVAKQGVDLRKKDVVLVRTGRMTVWPDFDGYLLKPPGINLPAAKWLCEEAGAMCIAGDSIGLEVMPWDEPDAFLPVHAYMFATAGAQIIEVVDMEEIAAEKQYEFAFLGFPMKLRGATGAPMPSYAVPLRK